MEDDACGALLDGQSLQGPSEGLKEIPWSA